MSGLGCVSGVVVVAASRRQWRHSALRSAFLLALNAICWTLVVGFLESSDSMSAGCLQLLTGYVGGGNYTYYRLSHEGDVVLTLRTVAGDADIYVSQQNLQPTYDLNLHDLQSVTCGTDRVHIPRDFSRPVGIAIYGHPSREFSAYQLCVNLINVAPMFLNSFDSDSVDGAGDNYNDHGYDYDYDQSSRRTGGGGGSGAGGGSARMPYYDKDDEESVLWSLLISALKVFVEIIT